MIAQEVESVLPQSVTQTELKLNDGSVLKDARGININGVVALLVEALKEERAARRVGIAGGGVGRHDFNVSKCLSHGQVTGFSTGNYCG